jgi:hypothetical protein
MGGNRKVQTWAWETELGQRLTAKWLMVHLLESIFRLSDVGVFTLSMLGTVACQIFPWVLVHWWFSGFVL